MLGFLHRLLAAFQPRVVAMGGVPTPAELAAITRHQRTHLERDLARQIFALTISGWHSWDGRSDEAIISMAEQSRRAARLYANGEEFGFS